MLSFRHLPQGESMALLCSRTEPTLKASAISWGKRHLALEKWQKLDGQRWASFGLFGKMLQDPYQTEKHIVSSS